MMHVFCAQFGAFKLFSSRLVVVKVSIATVIALNVNFKIFRYISIKVTLILHPTHFELLKCDGRDPKPT